MPFLAAGGILEGPIVPACFEAGRTGFQGACQLCDLVHLADNLIKFGVAFAVLVATGMFVYAGILYFTSAADPKNTQKAHKIFSQVFIGLILILAAWLIVDLIVKTLTEGKVGVWNDVACQQYTSTEYAAPTGGGFTGTGIQGAGSSCVAPSSGPCSAANLAGLFGTSAGDAGAVCSAESGGNPTNAGDFLLQGRAPVSFGLFQVNISANQVSGPDCGGTLNCPSAFSGPVTVSNSGTVRITNQALYDQCKAALQNPKCNAETAQGIWERNGKQFDGGRSAPIWTQARNCGIR